MVNLIVAPSLDRKFLDNGAMWLQKARYISDDMIASGNQIAMFRKSELEQLDTLLARLPDVFPGSTTVSDATAGLQQGGTNNQLQSPLASTADMSVVALATPISGNGVIDEAGFGGFPTTAHVMDLANSIDTGDAEWLSQAIMDHNIW